MLTEWCSSYFLKISCYPLSSLQDVPCVHRGQKPITTMESHIKSVVHFEGEDGKAEPISSPRSLEACLRSGWDPQELMPRRVAPT